MELVSHHHVISNNKNRIRVGKLNRDDFSPSYSKYHIYNDQFRKNNSHWNSPTHESKFIEDVVEKNRFNPLNILNLNTIKNLNIFTPQNTKTITKAKSQSKQVIGNKNKNLFDQINHKLLMTNIQSHFKIKNMILDDNLSSGLMLKKEYLNLNKNQKDSSKLQMQMQERSKGIRDEFSKFTNSIKISILNIDSNNISPEKEKSGNTQILNPLLYKRLPNIYSYLDNKRFLKQHKTYKTNRHPTSSKTSEKNGRFLFISKTLFVEPVNLDQNSINTYNTINSQTSKTSKCPKNSEKSKFLQNNIRSISEMKIAQAPLQTQISQSLTKKYSFPINHEKVKRKDTIIENRFFQVMTTLKEMRNVKAISNIIEMAKRMPLHNNFLFKKNLHN